MPENKMTFEEVKFWLAEARSCQLRQDEELKKRNCYPFLIHYYEGDQYPTEADRESQTRRKMAIINEYFPNVNALISEIMFQNPDILLEATKPDGEVNAPIMKGALSYGFKRLDALTENRLALFDMIFAGYAGVEINHINSKNTEVQPQRWGKEESLLSKVGNKIKEALSSKEIEEKVEKTLPASEIAYSTPDETYLRRWNPIDILLDYQAERIKDMRYTIKKIRWTYAKFIALYPEYEGKIKMGDASSISYSMQADDRNKKTILLYEFQLKQKDRFVNFIISPAFDLHEIDYFQRPYTTNGFNLKIGTLSEYGVLYPVSFAKINKAIQDDINNYVTFQMEVAERNIPKIGYDKNKVKEDGIIALRSTKVNDLVPSDGPPTTIPIQPTGVSRENKELLVLFQQHKDKLWSISGPRIGQVGKAEFMGELEIQEAGFMARQADIQEGLRKLIVSELETLKDIIVSFWDDPMFFKITGGGKPDWYKPIEVPNPLRPGETMVTNALTDILTADYEVNVDISTSLKPNKERKKKELIDFATWITSPNVIQFAQMQGYQINIEVIKKVAKEWGWNPETLLSEIPQPTLPPPETEIPSTAPLGAEVSPITQGAVNAGL